MTNIATDQGQEVLERWEEIKKEADKLPEIT